MPAPTWRIFCWCGVRCDERELAIRSAIGASWWDLARQILSEALLLAAIGALGGLAIAWLGIHELLAIAPAHLPRLDTIRIDSTVLIFTVILSLIAAAIFGLAPAWRAARPDVMLVLRGTSRNEGLASGGLSRKIVVGLEVALAYVLLIGSGLMVRSFLELQRIDPGFHPHGLLTFQVQSDRFLQTPEERAVRHSPARRAPARHSRSAKRNRRKSISAYRWVQPDSLGHRGSAYRREQI